MPISFLQLQTVNETVNETVSETVSEIVNDLSLKLDSSEPKIFTGGADVTRWSKLSKAEKSAYR
jgi:hypothetical protein